MSRPEKLATWIPQRDDDPGSWQRFLEKAAKGSVEAVEMLSQAELALLEQRAGVDLERDTGWEQSLAAIVPARPFETLRDLLDLLWDSGYLPSPLADTTGPFLGREAYSALWARRTTVKPVWLVHDAALHCWGKWGGAGFVRLTDEAYTKGGEYNSQDAVAAMLFLLITWGSSEPHSQG